MTALPAEEVVSPEAPALADAPSLQLVTHAHTWHLVRDEYDEYGYVRVYECQVCEAVRCL